MVMPEHESEWPDKAMFAGILLTLAGALGILFALLRLTDATFGEDIPVLLAEWPLAIMFPAAALALVLGVQATRHQAAIFVYLGSLMGIISLAGLGLVPILCVLAIGFMVRAHFEGEDTVIRTPPPDSDDWPDKAFAASLVLFVTGIITLFQGILTYTGTFAPVLWGQVPAIWATIAVLAGAFCVWSAREIFHLRRAWAGTTGCIVGILGLGLFIVGPILCVIGLVLLALAHKEDEFLDQSIGSHGA